MPITIQLFYRATIWTLSATACAVEGWRGMVRRIVEEEAESEQDFIALVTDRYTRHPDDAVYFGPISERFVQS